MLVVAGPTAVGKTDLTLDLAERTGAEIIVADSRQIYRGLDIGTAKPTLEERRGLPHHLLDVLEVGDASTAGDWHRAYERVLEDVQARGRDAIVTGGSTLYIDSVLRGPSGVPPVSDAVKRRLEVELRAPGGPERLYDELRQSDPETALTLDPTKTHRLLRYVGVLRDTGRAPSSFHEPKPDLEVGLLVLTRPREELYDRINRRVDAMIGRGLVDEVARLRGRREHGVVEATIGYQELLPVLDGKRGLEDGIRFIKRNSRRYAKRQLTWFRRYPTSVWLDARVATVERVLEAVPWT